MSEIVVEKILNGKLLEWTYFVHEKGNNVGFIVDPGYDIEAIEKKIFDKNYFVDTILLTHAHFDHMYSAKDIVEKHNSRVYMDKDDEELISSKEHNYATFVKNLPDNYFKVDKFLKDYERLKICNFDITCIKTPGHTKGGMCYYLEKEKILFSGDTLFFEAFGRTDLYGGNFTSIKESLTKLFKLPDDVVVFPGHGDLTTIKHEKEYNFMKYD